MSDSLPSSEYQVRHLQYAKYHEQELPTSLTLRLTSRKRRAPRTAFQTETCASILQIVVVEQVKAKGTYLQPPGQPPGAAPVVLGLRPLLTAGP